MFQAFAHKTINKRNSLLTISMSILFIGLILLNSCVPRSVRHGAPRDEKQDISSIDKKNQSQQERNDFSSRVEDFSNMVANKEENVNRFKTEKEIDENFDSPINSDNVIESDEVTQKIIVKRKIPTLREQMKEFSDKQNEIDDKVDLLQGDVEDIKNELNNIKNAIMDLDLNANHKYSKGSPETPIRKTQYQETQPKQQIILPDEKVKKNIEIVNQKETKIISVTENKKIEELLISGKEAYQSGDIENAIIYLNELIKTESKQETKAEAHFILGETYFTQKDYINAIKNYKNVIEIERAKQKEHAQNKIAESYVKTGDIENAISAYSQLIANYPGSEFIPKAKKMLQKL